MPHYYVEGTSGHSDQRVIEARDPLEAIKKYLHYPGIHGLLSEYDEDSDPRGIYGKGDERWSRVTVSISPPFEVCEVCNQEADDGRFCYEHDPEMEDEED